MIARPHRSRSLVKLYASSPRLPLLVIAQEHSIYFTEERKNLQILDPELRSELSQIIEHSRARTPTHPTAL